MNNREAQLKTSLWRKAIRSVSSFVSSEAGVAAKRHFTLLLLCMLSINGLNVLNSYVGRDFISSVESRDMPRFMWVSLAYVLVFAFCTVIAVYYRFAEERLALLWREWQTKQFLARYLANRTYLRLAASGEVENPDQRIAADVRAFATSSLSIFLMTLNAAFTVIAFSGVMWAISPLLFAGAVVYGLLGTVVTISLGRRLVGLNYLQADKEAIFRSELLQVRKNAEETALLRRESQISDRLLQQFRDVVANAKHVITVNRNVSFFTTGYNYLIPVIPVFVVAHLFMWGRVEFGVITQSAMAFAQLMGAFSLIVTQFQSMSSYAAVMNRIRVLGDAMSVDSSEPEGPLSLAEENGSLSFENVTLKASDGRPLVLDLSFSISCGQRLLIRAENNRATRALFRAAAGLTREGEGLITRPDAKHIFFLPELPNLPKDTLRRVLAMTTNGNSIADTEFEMALDAVGLAALPVQFGGFDVEQDWREVLSLHEQSLLAVARAWLARPDFIFFDHLGSALDQANVKMVFKVLMAQNIGYVSLDRTRDGTELYDHVLLIAEGGTWSWK